MPTTPGRNFTGSSRFQTLCSQLYNLAYKLGPDAKLPTVVELRHEMGVSVATLNTALKELESQNIIIRRHGVGIYVAPELHRKSICFVCDPVFFTTASHSPFWDILMEQSRARAEAHNELFEVHFAHPNGGLTSPLQRGLARDIESGQVDGIVGVGLDDAAADWIEGQAVPYVAFFGKGKYRVNIESTLPLQLALEALRDAGCARVGVWNPKRALRPEETGPAAEANAAFARSLQTAIMPIDPTVSWDGYRELPEDSCPAYMEQGQMAVRAVFEKPRETWPDGLFISDDNMTLGAAHALDRLGVRIGRDLVVVSHANQESPVLRSYEDDLILVEYNLNEMIDSVFGLLERVMEGKDSGGRHIYLPPKLRYPKGK